MDMIKKILSLILIVFSIYILLFLIYKRRNIINIIKNLSMYNIINFIFIQFNYVNLNFRRFHLITLFIIPIILFIILPFYNLFYNQSSSILLVTFISYCIFIFFVNGMNAKRVCGKAMGILELLNFKIFDYYKFWINNQDYIKNLKEYICFNDEKLTEIENHNNKFTFKNTKRINNKNTNYYNLNNNNYNFNITKEGGNTGKYITLTIYNFIILGLQILNFSKIEENIKILKFSFSILFCLTIFIWVCILNFPIWILILIILTCMIVG